MFTAGSDAQGRANVIEILNGSCQNLAHLTLRTANFKKHEDMFLTQKELDQLTRKFRNLRSFEYDTWQFESQPRADQPRADQPHRETFLVAILTRTPVLQHLIINDCFFDEQELLQLPKLLFGFRPPLKLTLYINLYRGGPSVPLLRDLTQRGYNQLRSFTCGVHAGFKHELRDHVFLLNGLICLQAQALEYLSLYGNGDDFGDDLGKDYQLVFPIFEKLTELSIGCLPAGAFRQFQSEKMPKLRKVTVDTGSKYMVPWFNPNTAMYITPFMRIKTTKGLGEA